MRKISSRARTEDVAEIPVRSRIASHRLRSVSRPNQPAEVPFQQIAWTCASARRDAAASTPRLMGLRDDDMPSDFLQRTVLSISLLEQQHREDAGTADRIDAKMPNATIIVDADGTRNAETAQRPEIWRAMAIVLADDD